MRFWMAVLLGWLGVAGASFLIWWWGHTQAEQRVFDGPLVWGFAASSFPCGAAMYFATRRWNDRHPRLLAAVVGLMPIVLALVATGIAMTTGTAIPMTPVNLPFLAVSLGWQLGGGFPGNSSRAVSESESRGSR